MSGNVDKVNRNKARTGFSDETGPWYILDNAGTIMPPVTDSVSTSLFRIQATIDEPVNLAALQEALEATARRFPYFTLELRRGFFWYYLEPFTAGLRVEEDTQSPSQDFNINKRGTCLFRVRAKERRIACEFSHCITDGTGGLRFLKNLLVEYFRLRGTVSEAGSDPDIYRLDEAPDHEESEDAYNRYFTDEYPAPDPLPRAFHMPSAQLPRHRYRVTTGIIPLEPALAKAKELGASLTELLAAVYMDALQSIWLASPAKSAKRRPHLAVEVPVNMRKFYPTRSNRNFSLFVLATQDMRLGPRGFPEIVSRMHHQLRYEIDERTIAQQISRNVSGVRNIFVRLVPLAVKDLFARLLFSSMGEDLLSGFVSNLGVVTMPKELEPRIERFEFIPAPGVGNKTSGSVLSWRGMLYFSFGSLAKSHEMERLCLTRLRRLGLPVKVECNFPD